MTGEPDAQPVNTVAGRRFYGVAVGSHFEELTMGASNNTQRRWVNHASGWVIFNLNDDDPAWKDSHPYVKGETAPGVMPAKPEASTEPVKNKARTTETSETKA